MSSEWRILTKLRCKLLRGCYTQATYLTTLWKVEDPSTFLATCNATIAVAKWGVTREFFPATGNATNVALQVARKIALCNMALKRVVTALMLSLVFRCFSLFLPDLRTLSPRGKVAKLSSFWDWWAKCLFLSIIVAKYNIFPLANNCHSRKTKILANRFAHAIS